jgi:ABC-type glycerol-3-phosphate transport system substrate-binding protein
MTSQGQAREIGWRSFRPAVVKTGFSRMPAGTGGSASALGGTGTAVSLRSTHRREALAFLRFQLRVLMHLNEDDSGSGPTQADSSDPPSISAPRVFQIASNQRAVIVARPSVAVGGKYKQVSRAYIDAVHGVLAGQRAAPEAAAELEKQLIEITGFRAGPPETAGKIVR